MHDIHSRKLLPKGLVASSFWASASLPFPSCRKRRSRLKKADPPVRVWATTGEMGWARSVQASTTTEMFVAQEMMKPNSLVCTPNLERLFRISRYGSDHS